MSALALVTVLTLSAGCGTTKTVYVQEPLPIPDRPNVPTIQAADLSCLSDEAYAKLVERDALQFEHIKRLEAIIMTTHRQNR